MKSNLLSLLILFLISSCATVKFYEDANLTKESGIEFYSSKPYLLVERKPAKDIAIKSTIIYLPDMVSPKYAKLKPGFGSSDLKLNLSNGIITSYGVVTDSKVPETITALTGVLGTTGTTAKALAEIFKANSETAEQSRDASNMGAAAEIIRGVISDVEKMDDKDMFSTNQQSILESTLSNLKTQQIEINSRSKKQIPKIINELDEIIDNLNSIKIESDSDKAKDMNTKLSANINEISMVREMLQPKQKIPEPTFELYEIVIKKNKTELKLVKFPEK